MDKKNKHSSKKFDTLHSSRAKWPSRSKSFSAALRISSGRDRSPLKIKRRRVCTARRLTGGITLRKRKRCGTYRRILSAARLRRARNGLAKRGVLRLHAVRFLARCAQTQARNTNVVAQTKRN